MLKISCGVKTDQGDVRAENQDSILCLTGIIKDEQAALFAVADGMGGLSFGAQVSGYITNQFERWWNVDFRQLVQDGLDNTENIRELLEQEIWDINQAVLDFKNKHQCRSGSTLSLLLVYRNRYYIENIGDSRVYLLRNQVLHQLTKDQSLVAQMVEQNQMTEREARTSKVKNVLTMCVGMFQVPLSGFWTEEIVQGDKFLVCSDGLYNALEVQQIEEVIENGKLNAQEKADLLRQMIEPGAAKDNVSVIIAETEDTEEVG